MASHNHATNSMVSLSSIIIGPLLSVLPLCFLHFPIFWISLNYPFHIITFLFSLSLLKVFLTPHFLLSATYAPQLASSPPYPLRAFDVVEVGAISTNEDIECAFIHLCIVLMKIGKVWLTKTLWFVVSIFLFFVLFFGLCFLGVQLSQMYLE